MVPIPGPVRLLELIPLAAGVLAGSSICDVLNSRVPGRVSYSGDSIYTASLSSYYTGHEKDLYPSCIFRPTCTAEVSKFLQIVGTNDHRTSPLPQFAVRGGGHTLFTGAANINGSVTVDMRSMKSLALSEDRKIASVGGGSIFSDLYPQLEPYNLTVMGGRVPGIGVGGFTTGGKLAWRRHICRNLGFKCTDSSSRGLELPVP
jgi:FAD/FMN-containing dehydrogenase